jgi:ribose transport system substrate-binding protein
MEAEMALMPAGMLVVGWDAALADTINKVMDAGIPVVTIDADVPASNRYTFIGTGNYLAGVESAKLMGQLLGGKGKVSASYNPSLSNVSERAKGFKEYITANFPDMQILADIDSQSDSALAAKAAAAVIQANPDIAGIACFDATAPTGVATAVREAGMTGKILIGGVDRNTTDLDMIKEGVISYSIVQKTALMSYLGVKLLHGLNHYPLPIVNDNAAAKMVPLPAVVDTGTSVIDKNNVDLFYPVEQ